MRRIAMLALASVLGPASAVAPLPPQALGDYIKANLASVWEGNRMVIPDGWCLAVSADPQHNRWMFVNPLDRQVEHLAIENAFQIPFTYETKDIDGAGFARFGAIAVGYELDPRSLGSIDDRRRLPPEVSDACDLGSAITMLAPWAIIEIGYSGQLSGVTQIDPAPDYRWWHLLQRTLRVRFLQRIPATYLVNGTITAGHVVVAFNH
jgi:hypothetical protein